MMTSEGNKKPLTPSEIDTVLQSVPDAMYLLMMGDRTVKEFRHAIEKVIRAVESAHGIK